MPINGSKRAELIPAVSIETISLARDNSAALEAKAATAERNREQNDHNLRDLRGVITSDQKQTCQCSSISRDGYLLTVENEADGDEPAIVKIDLSRIAKTYRSEKLHADLDGFGS